MSVLQVEVTVMRSTVLNCLLTEGDSQEHQEEGEEQRRRYKTPTECQCQER